MIPSLPAVFRRAAILGTAALLATLPSRGAEPVREHVLFPFDDYSLPFSKGLIMTLMPGHKSPRAPSLGVDPKHPGKPVLPVGKKGDPDFPRAYFYGTVLFIDGEYRMWYAGHDGSTRQVCYAVSKDGVNWEKPKLGLVEYKGKKENNLVSIDGSEPVKGMDARVLYEPEDPNPERRFKMIREITPADVRAAVSADGIRWKSVAGNTDVVKGGNLEPSGLIKFNGAYYLNGHGGPVPHPIATRGYMRPQKRMMVTLVSYDFENWTDAGYISFRRDNVPPRPPLDFEFHRGEQVHLGASLWNRGNVVLGFYGQYHNESNDRRTVSCDLGFIVSNDAIHFREPLPDFKMVPAFEEDDRAEPRLTQGQGFQNIGDRSFVYYGIWTENDRNSPTGVRVATWPRDRFGYFSPAPETEGAHCISAPFMPPRADARVFVNVTGLSEAGQIQVAILDEQMRPVPGYTAEEFTPFAGKSGLRLPVAWKSNASLNKAKGPVRVRVNWTGAAPQNTRLFAVYVE